MDRSRLSLALPMLGATMVMGCTAGRQPSPMEQGSAEVVGHLTGSRFDGRYGGVIGDALYSSSETRASCPAMGEADVEVVQGVLRGLFVAGPVGFDGAVTAEGTTPGQAARRLIGKLDARGFHGVLEHSRQVRCYYAVRFARRRAPSRG